MYYQMLAQTKVKDALREAEMVRAREYTIWPRQDQKRNRMPKLIRRLANAQASSNGVSLIIF